MTISITTNKTGPTAGDGVVTTFNYNFRIDDEDDLVVIHTDAAGVESTLTIGADYTVAGVGEETGGTITYPVSGAPLPAAETLTLKRVIALTQTTNLRNQGGYFPEVQEGALDRLEMQIQQLDEQLGRALLVPPSTDLGTFSAQLPSPLTASYFLAINSGATGLTVVQSVPSGSVAISVFAETILDDTTAGEVLTTLGVTAFIQTLLDDTAAAAARATLEIDGSSGKIVAGDLAADAVETAKIKDLAVTAAKLAVAVNPLGKQTIAVPAGAMTPRATNGPANGSVETATNKAMLKTLDFDPSTAEYAQVRVPMPKGWNKGTVSFIYGWSHNGGANFGVGWAGKAVAVGDGDAQDAAFGTAVTVTDTGGTTDDLYITAESGAVTVAGSPAEGDEVIFQFYRDVGDAGDDLTVDARLHWVKILFTLAAASDD